MENGGKISKKREFKIEKSVRFAAESIIENALNLHATDVHIEPREGSTLVRFRINGVLRNMNELSPEILPKLAKYFKMLGDLNFSEKTFPQSAMIWHGGARIRISTTPVLLGEKVTLRLIRARENVRKLSESGIWGENLRLIQQALRQPRGIIFTIGNGKNTTNFALLNELNSPNKNIVTIEKTIEKILPGINQTEIKPKIGLNYFEMTKSAFNQNPDIIYIDNLADKKTAELIFDASMRGKFVIASLPVSKTSEVVPFLTYLGIEPFLINANTLAIVGQALVRTVPKKSTTLTKLSKTESSVILKEFKISADKLHSLEKGSKKSNQKLLTSENSITNLPTLKPEISPEFAFTGTTAIFEVISFLDGKLAKEIKSLVSIKPNSTEIEEILEENKFTSLKIDGLLKVLKNETVLPEILRQTGF